MNKMYKKWTIEEKDKARHLLSQYTIRQVSKKMNRSIGSIKEIASHELKENYCRSRKYREESGLLQSSVARELGVTRSHVNSWIKTNNLLPKKCGKKGFNVVEAKMLFEWLESGYSLLPMLNPFDVKLKIWICKQRTYFIHKHISATYIRHISNITRGALDNWIRNFGFPNPVKKIGKIGIFFDRNEVVEWARNNPKLFNEKRIVKLKSYDDEHDFLNIRMKFKCVV
jgi:transcriptional regulator with XRE-family HTH domain